MEPMKQPVILSFGEILWDIFPDAKHLGGAPLNFAAHFNKLGGLAYMVSALGRDELGNVTRSELAKLGLSTDFVDESALPTGTVQVALDDMGVPSYTLVEPVSYDDIHTKKAAAALEKGGFDALYYGTLAQRRETSRSQLQALRCVGCKTILCDVNIRGNFITKELLTDSVAGATLVKISEEEWPIFDTLGITRVQALEPDATKQLQTFCRQLAARFEKLKLILLTLGKDGAMVFDCKTGNFTYGPKPTSPVTSTVGAGDSFTAAFLYAYLTGSDIATCLKKAVLLSDFVVTKQGAVPDYPETLVQALRA